MHKLFNKVALVCATVGPVGYLPASGTCASVLTVVLAYFFISLPCQWAFVVLCSATVLSAAIIAYALPSFATTDPRECVLDEVIGMAWVLLALPKTIPVYLAALVFFRFFDITKWLGVAYIERYAGWRGVLGDDLCAALWARICVHVCLLLW
jgi:phosphatidylglycerophosphatase A